MTMNKVPVPINTQDLLELPSLVPDSDHVILVHQCNSLTRYPKGLAEQLFKSYPFADIYRTRKGKGHNNIAYPEYRSRPGTCLIYSDKTRHVANLIGQWRPGSPLSALWQKYDECPYQVETKEQRLKWFQEGLDELALFLSSLASRSEHNNDTKEELVQHIHVGFPKYIGCGLAGGHWPDYESLIHAFEFELKQKQTNMWVHIIGP